MLVAFLAACALLAPTLVATSASAEPATDGWRIGWCQKNEGLTVVVDFGETSERGYEVRCRIGGDYASFSTDSRFGAMESVGWVAESLGTGLVDYIDGVGFDWTDPEADWENYVWWMYSGTNGIGAWSGAHFSLPAGNATNWFYGACLSASGCTPRADSQFEPFDTTVAVDAPAPVVAGTSATITVSVTPSAATGDVELSGLPGGTLTSPLVDGTATFTLPSGLAAGTYQLTAHYGGDADHVASDSDPVALQVQPTPVDNDPEPPAPTPSKASATVALSGASAAAYGKAARIVVAVSSASGTPTGSVTLEGAGRSRTKALSGGKATFVLPRALAVGRYRLTATYDGSATIRSATSPARRLTVGKGTLPRPTLTIGSKATSERAGSATIRVRPANGRLATPAGRVAIRLKQGKTVRRTAVNLVRGAGAVTLPKLAEGIWLVRLSYRGNATYKPSKSRVYRLKVRPAAR